MKKMILFYIGGERRVVLIAGDIIFEFFSQIRRISGSDPFLLR